MEKIAFKILDERLGTEWPLPAYHSAGAAGIDLRACIPETLVLQPNESQLISAGFAVHIRHTGIAAVIIPRSGMGNKGLVIGNLVGLIDSDYQGPISISCWNRTAHLMKIEPGDRVAQMVFIPVVKADFEVVTDFEEKTARGEGGFGSTGSH